MASNPTIPSSKAMTTSVYLSDTSSPNTTFVQTDPSTFRAVVQKLTGAPDNPSAQKYPVTTEDGPKRPPFKLHERRHPARKLQLELELELELHPTAAGVSSWSGLFSMVTASPVSTLECFARGSPRTPVSPLMEEERAIADKGFFLHPSTLATVRETDPPQLLPLFPLRSPAESSKKGSSTSSPRSSSFPSPTIFP